MGLVATTLFLTGHDCGHGSFTSSNLVNRRLGALVMLPSLQPFSVWAWQHNRVHHRWPNLRGRDFVWVPRSTVEYAEAGRWMRAVWRVDRTTVGMLLYYCREIWWRRQIWPCLRGEFGRGGRRSLAAVAGFAFGLLALCIASAGAGSSSWSAAVGKAVVSGVAVVATPFVVTMWFQGFGTFYNHTDARVPWFDDERLWERSVDQVTASVHLTFRPPLGWAMGNVFEHQAHHLDPRVPLCNLARAQLRLTGSNPGGAAAIWTVRHHRRTLRVCRLYDYRAHRWTDFDGRPTSPVLVERIRADLI